MKATRKPNQQLRFFLDILDMSTRQTSSDAKGKTIKLYNINESDIVDIFDNIKKSLKLNQFKIVITK